MSRYSNNHDITSRCNLFCEGCYYFEGDDHKSAKEEHDLAKWYALHHAKVDRGVIFPNYVRAARNQNLQNPK